MIQRKQEIIKNKISKSLNESFIRASISPMHGKKGYCIKDIEKGYSPIQPTDMCLEDYLNSEKGRKKFNNLKNICIKP